MFLLTQMSFKSTVLVCCFCFVFFKTISSSNQITEKNCCRKQKNREAQRIFKTEVACLLTKISSLVDLCLERKPLLTKLPKPAQLLMGWPKQSVTVQDICGAITPGQLTTGSTGTLRPLTKAWRQSGLAGLYNITLSVSSCKEMVSHFQKHQELYLKTRRNTPPPRKARTWYRRMRRDGGVPWNITGGLRSPACRALLQMEGGLDGGGRLYPHLQVLATFIVTQLQMTAFLLKAW